ncbi:hypothetical protein ACS0TY_009755 [Phlomoides rotata]
MAHATVAIVMALLLIVNVECCGGTCQRSIILLAGQSNMVGEGGVDGSFIWDGLVPPESQPNPNILRLNPELQWEVAREPLHQGISAPCGVGPGLPFANSILQHGQTIGLVPCAFVQTNIDDWQRGTSNYTRALTRAWAAVGQGGGVFRALLWYQGEADSNDEARAESYKGKLVQFFNDLRNDLLSPYLPIIQVAVATGGKRQYRVKVREAQLNTGLPNVFCVDAETLNVTIQNDNQKVHLDTRSQVKLGKALANVFLNIPDAFV